MKRLSRRLLVGLTIAGVAIGALSLAAIAKRMIAARNAAETTLVAPPVIGGPFSLIDQTGKRVTDADFRGRYMLVYFGYTYCPDVCPTGLSVMSQALDILGPKGERVQPIFITVDPERDTPEVMADYVANFHPRLIGLTGSPDEIRAAAKAYRVYYEKVYSQLAQRGETEDADLGDPESDYLMSHSASTFLMGPDGRYIRVFAYGTSAEDMAAGIAEAMNAAD